MENETITLQVPMEHLLDVLNIIELGLETSSRDMSIKSEPYNLLDTFVDEHIDLAEDFQLQLRKEADGETDKP